LKIINRKNMGTKGVKELDIIETESHFYQIHCLECDKYVIICLSNATRGVIGVNQDLKTVDEEYAYLARHVGLVKEIHRADDTMLVLERLSK